MLVECINDQNWSEAAKAYIVEFPVKGNVYTVIGRNHTSVAGLGYKLEELTKNPDWVGFSVKRFKPVDEVDLTEITEVVETENIH